MNGAPGALQSRDPPPRTAGKSPPRTKTRKPAIPTDCGFFFVFQCFQGFLVLQNIETHFKKTQAKTQFCKQVCLLFCLLFACDEKSLGFLRAALFISPMIFSMSISATKPGYCFSIRQTSPELRDDLSRGILPFPFLRLCRRRNR